MKYVLVTGGVLSGVGKGVIASSLGLLLKAAGLSVTSIKIDPYLNLDAGTMAPAEHGEVYVLDDGGETDLDLGNYERFLDIALTKDNNLTSGKVYKLVIDRERRGDYLGKTVQVIPHITTAIQDWVERVAAIPPSRDPEAPTPDVCVIELGGTIGDIESMPFVEAMRQGQFRWGRDSFAVVHVSLVPVVGAVGEQKTKPTQHSVRELRALGLAPDAIMCRSASPLAPEVQNKLAQFCHVDPTAVIGVHDVSNLYHVPLLLKEQGVPELLLKRLGFSRIPRSVSTTTLQSSSSNEAPLGSGADGGKLMEAWEGLAKRVDDLKEPVIIALVGKYTGLADSYHSVLKALTHSAIAVGRKLSLSWIDAQALTTDNDDGKKAWEALRAAHGVLVPGGFGERGSEGKMAAIRYARESKVPFLGVCLGFQLAVTEFARNVMKWEDATSGEFDPEAKRQVVMFMPEISTTHMGGTMRCGARRSVIREPKSLASQLYNGATVINERHRHRYEVNPDYVDEIEAHGLLFVGRDNERMEIAELPGHPFFLAVQFHPEFNSRPLKPSPPFFGLLAAATGQLKATPLASVPHQTEDKPSRLPTTPAQDPTPRDANAATLSTTKKIEPIADLPEISVRRDSTR